MCGCGTSVSYTPLRAYHRGPRRSPEAVDLFVSEPPTQPHVGVGILQAEQESDLSLDGTDHPTSVKTITATCIRYTD